MLKMLFALILLVLIFAPVQVSAQSRNVWIDGDHGRLSAVVQTPDGLRNFPLVIICHGFTGNKDSKLLTSLADYLEAEGIASIRFDFNGHGKSDGDFQDMTVLNEIEDAKQVYEYARDMRGVTSISIAGHSQGGVVTSMVAGQLGSKDIKSIALMAPAAVLRDDALRGILQGTNMCILVLAIFIASIGLNMNSTAVIIGAMLISPLMGNIIAIGYGMAAYDTQYVKESFLKLSFQVFLSILTSAIYFSLTSFAVIPSSMDLLIILSSTSVKFCTYLTS